MIASELKPIDEVLGFLEGEEKVFVVACDGCSAGCEVSDPERTSAMVAELEKNGKSVTGTARVEMTCNQGLVALMLMQQMAGVREADGILVMSCGVGVQTVAAAVEKPAHPATNSIYVGGGAGLWRSEPRCAECGNCMLDYTGGICPYTACSKSLLYGSCGGPNEGKCEVDPEVECGWMRIYERLARLGRADRLKEMPPLRNHRNMLSAGERRRTSVWALELVPREVLEEEARSSAAT
ncbi:MAG: methylenetetrahydrofolate reductase C-terminal domain-containing protein [Armatimonadota bacterium]|nr:MAG: methylenetetrahydrofolate reductase C-terminal domain-containing protein [Armatimonadota bacterium]